MVKSSLSKILFVIGLTIVMVLALVVPMVPEPKDWSQFPLVPGLGQKARIIFFHVPVAWNSVLAYVCSMWFGIRYLAKKNIEYDTKSVTAAGLGTLFCLLATATGSLWAKFSWGSFWNWDPRETSIFVLLLIYGAYFALRSAIDGIERKAALTAVYSIIAGVTMPFFIFVMPRITGGLHPGSRGDEAGSTPVAQLNLPPNMLILFLASILGFSLLYFWLFDLRFRLAKLEHSH